jgi:hypothetical protein
MMMNQKKARAGKPRQVESGDLGDLAIIGLKAVKGSAVIDSWSSVLSSPTEQEIAETREKLERRQLVAPIRDIARSFARPQVLERFVIEWLAGGYRARRRFEDLQRGRIKFAIGHTRLGVGEEEGVGLQRALANHIRRLAKKAPMRGQLMVFREELDQQKAYDRLIRDLHLWKIPTDRSPTRRPWRLYQQMCAAPLAALFRVLTGRPHHGLVGMLMLGAEVFIESRAQRLCQRWNPMARASANCLNHPRRCSDGYCRRAANRVRWLVS